MWDQIGNREGVAGWDRQQQGRRRTMEKVVVHGESQTKKDLETELGVFLDRTSGERTTRITGQDNENHRTGQELRGRTVRVACQDNESCGTGQ